MNIDRILADLDVSQEQIRDPKRTIPWAVFVEIVDRFSAEIGDTEDLRQFGEDFFSSDSFRVFHIVGRALSKPRDVYEMGSHWMGPALFPMISAKMWEEPDGRLVQKLTLAEGHRDCPSVYHILRGCLIVAPSMWGHGPSHVDIVVEDGSATYFIRPTVRGASVLGRMIRAVRAPFTLPTMLNELFHQQAAIEANYTEIRSARDRIADQAHDLEQVNSIGRRLAQHVDVDQVADVMTEVLIDDLGALGMELWLSRDEFDASPSNVSTPESKSGSHDNSRPFRQGGRPSPGSPTSYLLEAASRHVGTLRVWSAEDEGGTNQELLVRLLPWIAVSLDNARSYAALERQNADLEERVKERTARLLSANHHLVKEIGERKKATEALLQSEAQLRASERLASIGTLAAGIAHEINNPIGSILASAQLAQLEHARGGLEPEVHTALTEIAAQAKRCGGIVRSVLQFSRDERTEKWDCEIHDIVTRSVRLVSSAGDSIPNPVALNLPSGPVWGRVNPIQVEQAIVNLLRNAFEAGAERVRVSAEHDATNRLVTILIQDDGPGIPTHEQHRIFEPFYTTKRPDGGTGLGLSVVHGIVAEHGGGLDVTSSPEDGTLASLTLPTISPPAVPIEDKPESA